MNDREKTESVCQRPRPITLSSDDRLALIVFERGPTTQ